MSTNLTKTFKTPKKHNNKSNTLQEYWTKCVLFYYVRNNCESIVTFFPHSLKLLCCSFLGNILSVTEHLQRIQKICDKLRMKIKQIQQSSANNILTQISSNKIQTKTMFKEPKQQLLMTGHFGKVFDINFSDDSKYIISASDDGKLIIWDPYSGNKELAITLNSTWVRTCTFSPSTNFVASGGLDNKVSIFKITDENKQTLYHEMEQHEGFISCIKFINDNEILSGSGDGICILYDIERKTVKNKFTAHTSDIMCIDINKQNPNLFVSGSIDTTAKVFDMRISDDNNAIVNFNGHTMDVNAVKWFVDYQSFITGSDDGTVRLFDMRSYRQLNQYINIYNTSFYCSDAAGVTSVDVSLTGSYIYAAYDNGNVLMWSSLKAEELCNLSHDSRVSKLVVSPNGYGLVTACWDCNLRLFT
eukprot:530952_1